MTTTTTTTSFGQFDILTGRGGRVNGHSGNRVFQRLVDHHKAKYASLERKQDKAWLIQSVLEAIKCEGARFMKQDEFGNWHELDHNEAFKKTGQAFREPCFHTRKPAATIEIEPSHAVSAEAHESNFQYLRLSIAGDDYYKQPRRHSCRPRPAPDGQGGKCERVDFTKMACERIGVFTGVCTDCHREQHAPASCDQFDKWLQECKAESETAHWILANTKECPNCHVRIENNNQQGYRFRHTTCVHCRHEFCWLCGEDCTEHGDGRKIDSHADINEGSIKVAPDAPPSSSSSDVMVAKKTPHDLLGMNRYVHYYQRFCARAQEQTLAEQHWEEVKQMEQSMARSNHASWVDLQLPLIQAKELLVDCHRVLKFANVFAYYTMNSLDNKEKHEALLVVRDDLFENYQEMLKRFTNELSELSGKPLDQMDRMELVNKARAVDQFMKNLLKWVKDGMMDVMNDDGVKDQVMDAHS